MQDCKSFCIANMSCATRAQALPNIQRRIDSNFEMYNSSGFCTNHLVLLCEKQLLAVYP